MKISVCSWSYRLSASRVAEEMAKRGVDRVQLALCPFVDPKAVVPGSAGDTESVAGTGGVESIDRQRKDVEEYLASGRWQLSSAMFNSRYEDYSTLETIRRTGGIAPDEHWEENRKLFTAAAKLAASFHRNAKGFVDHTTATFFYKDALITSDSSFAPASSLVWDASGRIFFEKATVYFGPFYRAPLTVYPDGGKPFSPKLPSKTGYEAEIEYFLGQVEGRKQKVLLTAKDARESIRLLIMERKSARGGCMIRL